MEKEKIREKAERVTKHKKQMDRKTAPVPKTIID